MGRTEGGVSAEIHFNGGREPAQVIAVAIRIEKGSFRKVHFHCEIGHPFFIRGSRKDAYCRRIAAESFRGERVHVDDGEWHLSIMDDVRSRNGYTQTGAHVESAADARPAGLARCI